ncbi:MAG: hypothetical protein ABI488_19255 [Polyangiaceae bacterium]
MLEVIAGMPMGTRTKDEIDGQLAENRAASKTSSIIAWTSVSTIRMLRPVSGKSDCAMTSRAVMK